MSRFARRAVRRRGPTVAPTDVTGLTHWLVADDIGGTSGAGIASWTDRVAGSSAVQATSASRPTYQPGIVAGHAVARFAGSQRLTTTPTEAMGPTFTVFTVSKWTGGIAGGSGAGILGADAGTGTSRIMQLAWANTTTANWIGFQTNNAFTTDSETVSTAQATAWNVHAGVRDTSTLQLWINGVSNGSTTGTGTPRTATRALTFGSSRDDVGLFYGDIAEVIVYGRALTSGERATVHTYLSGRYGITIA